MHYSSSQLSRRGFLQASCGAVVTASTSLHASASSREIRPSVIQIILTGGPSAQETFDPKPLAPANSRGPFTPISTAVPGLYLSEILPQLATRADRYSLVRTLHHDHPPIHEHGLQLLQTGQTFEEASPARHLASLVPHHDRPWLILPKPIGDTGVPLPSGQTPISFSPRQRPISALPVVDTLAPRAIGDSLFGQCCRAAVDAVRRGTRFVTINMFDGVFDQLSWDMHASSRRLWVSPRDYRDTIGPMFDQAMSALLDDLASDGALERVLVVAAGEIGRAPMMNATGGRDHWNRCWPALIAGGGITPGQVVGRTDERGGEPIDRPVPCEELFALMARHLGLDPADHANPLVELRS